MTFYKNIPSIYKKVSLELFLFFVLIVLLLPSHSFRFDTEYWKQWALSIQNEGVGNIYNTDVNYPPVMIYLLYLYDLVQGPEKIAENINYFKAVPLLFDLLPILLLIIFRKAYDLQRGYYIFLLFNIAYLFNSVVWGQVDSIHSNLALTAIFISFRYPVASLTVFILALNMKFAAIIFLPILIICLFSKINSVKTLAKTILVALVVQILLLIPFFLADTLDDLWIIITKATSSFPIASASAYNFWHLVLKTDAGITSDEEMFYLWSYKTIGLSLFFIMSTLALFPLIVKTINITITKVRPKSFQELVFLSSGMIAIIFIFFNTQMHERYAHPVLIFLFFYSIYRKNFILYILASFAYLLNLEKLLHFYNIPYHTLIFDTKFIASIYLIVLVGGIVSIYRNYGIKKDLSFLILSIGKKLKRVN
ncbi:hypothetical protein [Aurantibacillus circumpalustris]|uniref:hypothetical protein n=1 Tax=Aurantibacillus circumpalustris TaxID=3036359 RepID=UPI00295BC2F6|nr:hypothetical protein [Aurantibacillus circumpalustris]